MNRLIVLLFIAVLTAALVMLYTNPGLFEKVYLYILGLFGFVVKAFQLFIQKLKASFKEATGGSPEAARPARTETVAPAAADYFGAHGDYADLHSTPTPQQPNHP